MSEDNLLNLAKSHLLSGQLEDADSALTSRLKVQPIQPEAVVLLAEIKLKRGLTDEATALLEKHKHLAPCSIWLREYYIGERRNAEAARVIQSLPKTGSLGDLINQAIMYQLAGDARSAADLCKKVLMQQPANAIAMNHLGRALFNTGVIDQALAIFRKAVDTDPDYIQAWHNLGHVLRAINDAPAAAEAYAKAISLAPYYQSALLNLAILQMNQADNLTAANNLRSLLLFNPRHAEALLNLGLCHHIHREFPEALDAFERAAAIDPLNPRILRHLGNLHKEIQDSGKAIDFYRKALSLSPGDDDLWAELISTLELRSELTEASQAISEGLAHVPGSANITFESAKVMRRLGHTAESLKSLESLNPAGLHPRLLQSYFYEFATAADRMNRFEDAWTAFVKGNELGSTSVRARNTDRKALTNQIETVKQWLAIGAPASASEPEEDLGDDLCFLIGFPRSGTTLLDVMLDGHAQVLSVEEKPTIERVAFRLDRLPDHYPFAMKSLDASGRAELRTLYRQQIESLRRPEHTLVIDKMPIRTIHAAFIHRLFPKAKFLFAERHPCDVVLSNFMQNYAINEAMIHFSSIETTVDVYDRVMQLWQQTIKSLPDLSVHYVRYENLLEDTENTLREACRFLNLPWQSGLQDHRDTLAQRKVIKTNSYHQVAEPLYNRSKYRWINYRNHIEFLLPKLKPHIDRMAYTYE
jgi:tetratricopeptide (TPR) repeat protein